jgi:hypothetical protein
VDKVLLDRLAAGDSVAVSTASGSTYTFTVSGPRYGTLAGGRLTEPTLALYIGAQGDDEDIRDPSAIEVGRRARFLCPLLGEIVTTAVTRVEVTSVDFVMSPSSELTIP